MRAGRLTEILCNENIVVVGASGNKAWTKKYRSEWNLIEFAHRFPFTEVVKISPLNKDKLIVFVYDATAKALAEKRYEDVLKYADTLETHTFNDDIGYIESCNKVNGVKFMNTEDYKFLYSQLDKNKIPNDIYTKIMRGEELKSDEEKQLKSIIEKEKSV